MFTQYASTDFDTFFKQMREKGVYARKTNDEKFIILKYIKGKCDFSDPEVRFSRGLVLDAETYEPRCVAPTKSMKIANFNQMVSDWSQVHITDFVDGTMINIWFGSEEWHISTRSVVGAQCYYYSEKSFKEMFEEASEGLDFTKFNPGLTYSFVLRHPENRIVTSYEKPDLVLVQANWGWNEVNIHQVAEELRGHGMDIKTPQVYQFSSLEEILEKIASMEYQEQGLVLRFNNTRAKIRNPKYEQAKLLRGNNRNLFFTYLEHFKNHRVGEYLTYYPEHKEQFDDWFEKIKEMTTKLHTCYVEGFIRHNMDRSSIPYELKPHCYALHNLHKTTGNKVTKKYAIEYFNGLDIPQIIFIINYEKNKEYYKSKAMATAVTAETLLKEIEQKVEAVSDAVQENA